MIITILCVDKAWGIGKRNGLLFSLPKDMKFFRDTTLNHVVAMGENTLLSFPNSKPLKNRHHIVLSQDESHNYEGVENVHDFDEFLRLIAEHSNNGEDVYIIGGASVYRQTLPFVDKVLLTKVDAIGGAELFFPNLDNDNYFELVEQSEDIEDNGYTIRFCTYKNKHPQKIR